MIWRCTVCDETPAECTCRDNKDDAFVRPPNQGQKDDSDYS